MASNSKFTEFSNKTARVAGKSGTFILACSIVGIWAVTGPLFKFSDTWQLVINTGTTIITFLMVFLIQNTQNRDTEALQVKLDELIYVTKEARNELLDLEQLDEKELDQFRDEFTRIARAARQEPVEG